MVSTTRCDQLGDAGLALRRAELAVEVLAGDDVGGGLRPVDGHFDIALLEDDGAFVVADGGGAGLPLDFVVGGFAGFEPRRKVTREGNPRTRFGRCFGFNTSIFALRSMDNSPTAFSWFFVVGNLRNLAPIYSATSRTLSICSVLGLQVCCLNRTISPCQEKSFGADARLLRNPRAPAQSQARSRHRRLTWSFGRGRKRPACLLRSWPAEVADGSASR